LLTGSQPFACKSSTPAAVLETLRFVREMEPPRPSARLSRANDATIIAANRSIEPAKLTRLLRGELDWVVMKCLEKDRNRRYETANGLARDIQRYLTNVPVEARPPSVSYHLRKFLHRNRGPVLAALAVVVMLVAGVIGTSVGMVRAWHAEAQAISDRNDKEIARGQAAANAEDAKVKTKLARSGFDEARKAVDSSFTLVSESRLLKIPGLQPLRKSLLEEALKYYRSFADRWADEPTLRRELAAATFRIAVISSEIGDKQQAITDYQEASRLYRIILATEPNDIEVKRNLSVCDNNIAKILMELDRYTEALVAYERCEIARQQLLKEYPGRSDLAEDMADLNGNIALTLNDLERRKEALSYLNVAIVFRQQALTKNSNNSHHRHCLAGLFNTLGNICRGEGKFADAATAFRDAAEQEQLALNLNPLDNEYRGWLGNHYFNLALVCEIYLKKFDEALAARSKAADIWEKLAAENPAVTDYQSRLAQTYLDLGSLLNNMPGKGNPKAMFEKARPILEQLTRGHPDVARYHSSLGAVLSGIAGFLFQAGKLAEARELLDQAVQHQEAAIKISPGIVQFRRFLTSHCINLSRVAIAAKEPDVVISTLEKVVPLLEQLIKEKSNPIEQRRELLWVYGKLGAALEEKKRTDAAFAVYRRGISVLEDLITQNPGESENIEMLSTSCSHLVHDLTEANKFTEAVFLREHIIEFWSQLRKKLPASERAINEYIAARFELGVLFFNKRDAVPALKRFRDLNLELETLEREKPGRVQVQKYLGMCLKGMGDLYFLREDLVEATKAWEAALVVYREKLLPREQLHPVWNADIGGLLHNLAYCNTTADRHEKALALCEEAINYQMIAYKKNPDSSRQWLDNHYVLQASLLKKLKRPIEAATATRERIKLWTDQPSKLVDIASDLVSCIPAEVGDAKQSKLNKDLAYEAVALIAKAIKQGFSDKRQLEMNEALAPLREREDFRKLLADLANKK
jgi:tetratricopeptide (TPR) repeat protein